MESEILAFVRENPGSMCSAINKAVLRDGSIHDYCATRRELEELVAEGLVEAREYRGIAVFYPVELPHLVSRNK